MSQAATTRTRMRRGNLFVVSAPSGAGKTTLCRSLLKMLPDIRYSVSYTTRPPRGGEVNDRDYTFVDEGAFRGLVQEGAFVEWAQVHGHLYGTSKTKLDQLRESGFDVLLDIDTQGAGQLKERLAEGVYVFIMPPSLGALKARLERRMSNSPGEIEQRMRRAVEEIAEYRTYDYVIVNDVLDEALEGFKAVILAERLKTGRIDDEWIRTFIA